MKDLLRKGFCRPAPYAGGPATVLVSVGSSGDGGHVGNGEAMAKKHEAVQRLKRGYRPTKIAKEMGVTLSTVMNYLYCQVGEGRIRRSDIVFSIDQDTRDRIETLIQERGTTSSWELRRELEGAGVKVERGDLEVYLSLRDARVALGDMYEFIREIEVTLHRAVKKVLVSEYGALDWWRQGVPEQVRVECASSLERDPEPAQDSYCYTNFIHLKCILDKQWRVFSKVLPKDVCSDRKKLLSRLDKLNHIRNCVMHPVKGTNPTDRDFAFIREFRDYLRLDKLDKLC